MTNHPNRKPIDWNDYPAQKLANCRVIRISDGEVAYYAEMPAEATRQRMIDHFVSTYEFRSDDGLSDEEHQAALLSDIEVEEYPSFDPAWDRKQQLAHSA